MEIVLPTISLKPIEFGFWLIFLIVVSNSTTTG
jgi:hypothetical protein